ncbi:MAG: alanine racemase [Bacteroidota bacterium]
MKEILTPTILLDWNKASQNMQRMLDKAAQNGLTLRPHLKTAQSVEIGRRIREMGVNAITVSSLEMAEYFAEDGWDDITVAFPINVREVGKIFRLSRKVALNILIVNPESVDYLQEPFPGKVGVFIKIDVGTHRTGLDPDDDEMIHKCLEKIEAAPSLSFKGFLAHAGHSYRSRTKKAILEVHQSSLKKLNALRNKYIKQFPDLIIAPGDTPTCSVAKKWTGVDEIRPGNFIFYDLMQVEIGSCKMADIAVAMACPIVAKHADRKEIVVYGGGIHLSKDRLEWKGKTIFGRPVLLKGNGWEMPDTTSYVRMISQEHGVIKCSATLFKKLEVGGLVGILPVHSCMMADLMNGYLTTGGEFWGKMTK